MTGRVVGMSYREPTVAELIEQLQAMPPHYPATVVVNGVVGVITGVWCQPVDGPASTPHVIVGEQEPAGPIVPPEWSL